MRPGAVAGIKLRNDSRSTGHCSHGVACAIRERLNQNRAARCPAAEVGRAARLLTLPTFSAFPSQVSGADAADLGYALRGASLRATPLSP